MRPRRRRQGNPGRHSRLSRQPRDQGRRGHGRLRRAVLARAVGRRPIARPNARLFQADHGQQSSQPCSRRRCPASSTTTWFWANIAARRSTLARRSVFGRASVFRPANPLGAGQLRPDRSVADRRVHRPRRLCGAGEGFAGNDARRRVRHGRAERLARPRRRRLSHRQKMEVRPPVGRAIRNI